MTTWLGYQISLHIRGSQILIMGVMSDTADMEAALWQIADTVSSPDN